MATRIAMAALPSSFCTLWMDREEERWEEEERGELGRGEEREEGGRCGCCEEALLATLMLAAISQAITGRYA